MNETSIQKLSIYVKIKLIIGYKNKKSLENERTIYSWAITAHKNMINSFNYS